MHDPPESADVDIVAGSSPTPWVVPSSARRLSARLWRLCDALATAPARPKLGVLGHGLALLGRRTRHFDRPAAALGLVDSILPGTAAAWSRLALGGRKLPLKSSDLELLGFGTGDTVFRVGAPDEGVVLKIERISLGLTTPELVALARRRREAFADVVGQYATVPEVFPPVQFLLVQSPLFGVPAVGALQPYIEGPFRDVLRDIPEGELEDLVTRRPRLRAQVAAFLKGTIASWERGGWIVDLGRHNLVLAGEEDRARLVYLDVEMKDVPGIRGSYYEAMYEGLVLQMRVLLRELGSRSAHRDVDGRLRAPKAG